MTAAAIVSLEQVTLLPGRLYARQIFVFFGILRAGLVTRILEELENIGRGDSSIVALGLGVESSRT